MTRHGAPQGEQGPGIRRVVSRCPSHVGRDSVRGRAGGGPRFSHVAHAPAHPSVTIGPGGGTGQRARAVHGGAGRTVSHGPNRKGRALARGGGRQGPRANTWRRLIQRRRPTSLPVSRTGQRARATLKPRRAATWDWPAGPGQPKASDQVGRSVGPASGPGPFGSQGQMAGQVTLPAEPAKSNAKTLHTSSQRRPEEEAGQHRFAF